VGTGKASREFLFVKDAARAIVLATESLETSDPVNVGTGQEVAISDLAKMIAAKVGFQGDIIPGSLDGQPRRCLNVAKAERLFGFKATTSLDDGLDETIAWWKQRACSNSKT